MGDDARDKGVRLKVFEFFHEHPVHAFRVDTIARYLSVGTDQVQKALDDLVGVDVVDIRYQLTTAELTQIVDDMTRKE